MGFLQEIFGEKPDVPILPKLSLEKEQQKAISANLAALPEAQKLAAQANMFSRSQVEEMLKSAIPDYESISRSASANIDALLRGEIPKDVQQEVISSAAAKALGGGYAGSGAHGNLVARDLGLTSLDLTQKGLSSAESWLKTTQSMFQPSMMDLTSMFITPAQQAQFSFGEREAQFQRGWMESQIEAMPDPVLSGINQQIMDLMKSALGAVSSIYGKKGAA